MKNEKNWVEYKGITRPFASVERMAKWRTKIDNPDLVDEKHRHSAAIGMYRNGASWEQISAHIVMFPTHAEQIVNNYLKELKRQLK